MYVLTSDNWSVSSHFATSVTPQVATSRAIMLPPPPHQRLIIRFLNNLEPQIWRIRVSLFFWLLLLDLSGMGDPTSSYATAGIALGVSGALKHRHHDKVEILSVGVLQYHPM
jgi:hypothetical protein